MRKWMLAALLLVATACGSSTTSDTEILETPVSESDDISATALRVLRSYLETPGGTAIGRVIDVTSDSVDRRLVPYLIDLLRFTNDPALISPLSRLTGVTVEDDDVVAAYAAFGTAMLDAGIDPGASYPDWKSTLYSQIDPEFSDLLAQIDDRVTLAAIQWGGVPVGGVPELNDPERIGAASADYLSDEDLVFGATVGGATVAYPLRILDVHELANDNIAGIPVALANCTLCRSGVLFSRIVDSQQLTFLTSGLLLNSNKVMVDTETGSLWQQLTGEAIGGALKGHQLEHLPMTVSTWSSWVADHPETQVLALPDTGADRGVSGGPGYEPGEAYSDYYSTEELWFPALTAPDEFPAKTLVATLALDDHRLAVDLAMLEKNGPVVIPVGDEMVIAAFVGGDARFYLGATEEPGSLVAGPEEAIAGGAIFPRLPSGRAFWFAWYGTHPDTDWWPTG